jgi:WD40 repeat protein
VYVLKIDEDYKQKYKFNAKSPIRNLNFNFSSEILGVSCEDGKVHLLSMKDGSLVKTIKVSSDENWIYKVCFSLDNKHIGCASSDNYAHIFDQKSFNLIQKLNHSSGV